MLPVAARSSITLGDTLPGASLTFHAPGTVLRPHRHEAPYLNILLRGEYVEETSRVVQTLRAGDALAHPANERHGNRFSPLGAVCLNLSVQGMDTLSDAGASFPTLSARAILPQLPIHLLAPALGDALLGGSARDALAEALRRVFAVRRSNGDVPVWLRRVDRELQRRFRERCGLRELARDAGCSPAHLARSYRRAFGTTIGERLRALRLQWALDQIRNTPLPLSQVALAAGFANQAHMTRAIRQHTGRPPTVHRCG
jgi:AraC family transcriptional regulator